MSSLTPGIEKPPAFDLTSLAEKTLLSSPVLGAAVAPPRTPFRSEEKAPDPPIPPEPPDSVLASFICVSSSLFRISASDLQCGFALNLSEFKLVPFVSSGDTSFASVLLITAVCRPFPKVTKFQLWSSDRIKPFLSNHSICAPASFLNVPTFPDFGFVPSILISEIHVSSFVSFSDMFSTLMWSPTAVCSLRSCDLAKDNIRFLSLSMWQCERMNLEILSLPIDQILLDTYCPDFSFMEFICFLNLSPFVSGIGVGSILSDDASVMFHDSVAWCFVTFAFVVRNLIENCALVAGSISGFRSLKMSSTSQNIISLCCFFGLELRGLLFRFSCSSVIDVSIYLLYFICLFSVIVFLLAKLALLFMYLEQSHLSG